MVWAQAVDAAEVLRYNGRVSGKGGGQVLRQLKYLVRGAAVQLFAGDRGIVHDQDKISD